MNEKEVPNKTADSHKKWFQVTIEKMVETVIIAVNESERPRIKKEMEKLVKAMTFLAIDLARQRARVEFFYLTPNSALKESDVDVVNNRNRRETSKRAGMKIALVIAPGLKKIGDDRGGFWNGGKDTTVICPAEVFLDSN